jgi:hypothetical protein
VSIARLYFRGAGVTSGGAPGQITDLTTPTVTGTSFAANFSVPSGNITGYQYRIDGGTPTELGGGPGTAITNQVTGLAVDVEVRPMNGGVPGPWSNVSVGDPGVTLDIRFDNDDPTYGNGQGNGSWQDTPTGVVTAEGNKDYPDVGFAGTAGQSAADATACMLQFGRHIRYFLNSTAKINIYFGMGRTRSAFNIANFNWIHFPDTIDGVATNDWSPFSGSTTDLSYAQTQTLIGLLPDADQRSLYPNPGSFPWGGTTARITNWLKACIENTDFNATGIQLWITFATGWNWDWQLDTTVCAGGRLKASRFSLHELQQSGAFLVSDNPALSRWFVFSGSGSIWTSGTPKYLSIDNGVTNLGDSETVFEAFDLTSGSAPTARSSSSPAPGNAGMPASPMQLPGETYPFVPLRQPQDAKQFFAIWPASPWLKAAAGF